MAGDIKVTNNFEVLKAAPIDNRFLSDSIAERDAIAFRYPGLRHRVKGIGNYVVDDAGQWQEDKAPSALPIEKTYAETQALVAASTLVAGNWYKITNRGKTHPNTWGDVYLLAITNKSFAPFGVYEAKVPDYVANPLYRASFPVAYTTVLNKLYTKYGVTWKALQAGLSSEPPQNLTSNASWEVQINPVVEYDDVLFDFANNRIVSRRDKRNNFVSIITPVNVGNPERSIELFQWGNANWTDNTLIGCDLNANILEANIIEFRRNYLTECRAWGFHLQGGMSYKFVNCTMKNSIFFTNQLSPQVPYNFSQVDAIQSDFKNVTSCVNVDIRSQVIGRNNSPGSTASNAIIHQERSTLIETVNLPSMGVIPGGTGKVAKTSSRAVGRLITTGAGAQSLASVDYELFKYGDEGMILRITPEKGQLLTIVHSPVNQLSNNRGKISLKGKANIILKGTDFDYIELQQVNYPDDFFAGIYASDYGDYFWVEKTIVIN